MRSGVKTPWGVRRAVYLAFGVFHCVRGSFNWGNKWLQKQGILIILERRNMEDAEWIRSGQAIYSRDWINRAWRMERERGIFRRRILWRRRNGLYG